MTLFFDIETQNSFEEVGGHYPERLRLSAAVTYNTDDEAFHHYTEANVTDLVKELQTANLVVGYNLYGFDYPVLQKYTQIVLLKDLPTVDLMVMLEKRLGFRPKLDTVASATLKVGKSADGLQAVQWWREGRLEEIFKYCEQDVEVTRRLYEFGKQYRYVQYYDQQYRIQKVLVAW
ncbi:MAG: ribonuclease H-like domain-containing protein [Anaerolineae bacterium]|jgi:DEAD/DEAH box helicase domain-containing protein|nr:ribonuclease H-like domain-containing protein [Anaerolineae bacterium]